MISIAKREFAGDAIFSAIGLWGLRGAIWSSAYQLGKKNAERRMWKPYETKLEKYFK